VVQLRNRYMEFTEFRNDLPMNIEYIIKNLVFKIIKITLCQSTHRFV